MAMHPANTENEMTGGDLEKASGSLLDQSKQPLNIKRDRGRLEEVRLVTSLLPSYAQICIVGCSV